MIVGGNEPSARADAEVELDCDYNLHYEHVIEAITAVSGYVDQSTGQIEKTGREDQVHAARSTRQIRSPDVGWPSIPLRPRMELAVHFLEPRLFHVRVDLRRGDAGVAQHFLDLPQVGAAAEQVRGEAVPQRVRTDRVRQAGARRVPLDQFPDRFPAQTLSAARQQQPGGRRAAREPPVRRVRGPGSPGWPPPPSDPTAPVAACSPCPGTCSTARRDARRSIFRFETSETRQPVA